MYDYPGVTRDRWVVVVLGFQARTERTWAATARIKPGWHAVDRPGARHRWALCCFPDAVRGFLTMCCCCCCRQFYSCCPMQSLFRLHTRVFWGDRKLLLLGSCSSCSSLCADKPQLVFPLCYLVQAVHPRLLGRPRVPAGGHRRPDERCRKAAQGAAGGLQVAHFMRDDVALCGTAWYHSLVPCRACSRWLMRGRVAALAAPLACTPHPSAWGDESARSCAPQEQRRVHSASQLALSFNLSAGPSTCLHRRRWPVAASAPQGCLPRLSGRRRRRWRKRMRSSWWSMAR